MKTKQGIVTGEQKNKTAVVTEHRYVMHPKYKKRYRVSKKYLVHDPDSVCKMGETVTIIETRPISKLKRWKVATPEDIQRVAESRKEVPAVKQAEDVLLVALFDTRKRLKTRGQRKKEKASEGEAGSDTVAPAATAGEKAVEDSTESTT